MRGIPPIALICLVLVACDGLGDKSAAGPDKTITGTGPTIASVAKMNLVRSAIVARNFGDAAAQARALVVESPSDPEALLLLARCEALLGNGGSAVAALDRAVVAGLAKPVEALADPAFDDLRNDERFLQIAARIEPAAPRTKSAADGNNRTSSRAGSVEIESHNGHERIQAGDVVIEGEL